MAKDFAEHDAPTTMRILDKCSQGDVATLLRSDCLILVSLEDRTFILMFAKSPTRGGLIYFILF